ncbi:hypothetical protein [Rodentibacter pneumotropicus]|uniref:hypothetical protein n=1 Tax=Rodentibacter pneumotropicus TaxID=758 RepID=UPI000371CA02|nr:hypothetical protein [Rodentibacter pneumotropicus]NBH75088.1 hypothetical protein [Rodentibacter pneumotropicus]OOF61735.1 hypothetical protein BH925_02080 [Rodentibacter pneumotropicus]THA04502.1 hypothetical protein D3M72_00490 [Rodentibacter pneumotropicus]THA05617.1 hypothetical protein D3M73_07040 [Rodentibacter pneumotropicus]THA14270.1 hypothetical protein D3M81_00265 [Rodentibacter pneumotropicus]
MVALLKRLTNLDVVGAVMQSPAQYPSTHNGFKADRQKLKGDVKTVTSNLNRNIQKYGNQKYAS